MGSESYLVGQSEAWVAFHGSSNSGSNPALLGRDCLRVQRDLQDLRQFQLHQFLFCVRHPHLNPVSKL